MELREQTDSLISVYFNGELNEARRSILEANQLIEKAKLPPEFREGQAFTLFLGFARLYAIDSRSGSNDLAQVDFIKARYWCLRNVELHGGTPAECIAYVEKFADQDKLIPFIDKWDKNSNHGNSPKYIARP